MAKKKLISNIDGVLPLLPLRGIIIFPGSLMKIFIGRESSIGSVKESINGDNRILLSTQIQADIDSPSQEDLYDIGIVARIIKVESLQDGTIKVSLEGVDRFHLIKLETDDSSYRGEYRIIDSSTLDSDEKEERENLAKLLIGSTKEYLNYRPQPGDQVLQSIEEVSNDISKLIDLVVNTLPLTLEDKYELLNLDNDIIRIEMLINMVRTHIELLQVEENIHDRVRKQITKSQKEHYLNEQLKAIQKEIYSLDNTKDPFNSLEESIKKAKMSKEAEEKAKSELDRLRLMASMSAEATVVRGYIDTLVSLPWNNKTKVNGDINKARKQLNDDHYALVDVKDRILEYLAARKRTRKIRAPIICLVGPPGVGKTSLALSIAKATNRKFVRLSLGGVRDESEIRGHRKTYIGSMPGRIIQKMSKSGTVNPLFLLDEIDKIGQDFRGDPASALLEVLDPEQNNTFNDHYLEVDYDLSDVMFICTSNSMNIPEALLDRLEIIRIGGYTENEKLHIARRHLVTKLLKEHSIEKDLSISDQAITKIIRYYTREAGVRELERKLTSAVRKIIYKLESKDISKKSLPLELDETLTIDLLGAEKFSSTDITKENEVGVVSGLAWTSHGGEILRVETLLVPGKGKLIVTGSLGDVMKESVQAAVTVARSKSHWLGLTPDFFTNNDIHIHIPEGATPKDGPSAGIAMCTALFSLLSGVPICKEVAMTGELTISGKVLPIGGLKEKVLAAQRYGITKVIIPSKNTKDIKDIPKDVCEKVELIAVDIIDDVLMQALESFNETWLLQTKEHHLPETEQQLTRH